jgi:hypothetical protein
MRKSLALAVTGLTVASLAAVVPGTANAADTNVTFSLTGGSLTLTAPASATLTAAGALGVTGTSVSGQLGSTTVSDERGALTHSVTVTMSSTNFSDGAGNSVAATNATGYSGVATTSGVAVAVPTATGQALSGTGSTILTLNSVIGSGGATYNPTVDVTIPAGTVAGNYSGTVTQTAS